MSDRPTLDCVTYTRLWTFSRYTYTLLGHRLWLPISHRSVGYLLAVGVPLWGLMALLHVPFQTFGLTAHFIVPWLLTRWALKVAGHGARPHEFAWSWIRFAWNSPGFLPQHQPVRVTGRVSTPLAVRPVRIGEH